MYFLAILPAFPSCYSASHRLGTVRPSSFCTAFRVKSERVSVRVEDLFPWTRGNEEKPSPQCPMSQNQDVRTRFIALFLHRCSINVSQKCIQATLHFLVSSSLAKLQPIFPRQKSNRAPLSIVTLSAFINFQSVVSLLKNIIIYNFFI